LRLEIPILSGRGNNLKDNLKMKSSKLRTLLIGLIVGVAYAFVSMLIVAKTNEEVSVSYIFVLPVVLGAIPVLFSTKEQLKSYWTYILMPWGITFSFFVLSFVSGFEGLICLVIIVAPWWADCILNDFNEMILEVVKGRCEKY
jgi:hypothetical protein